MSEKSIVEISDYNYTSLPKDEIFHIYIRGKAFRGTFNQQLICIDSMITKIINPILQKGYKIKITLCCYYDNRNIIFQEKLNNISSSVLFFNKECDPKKIKSQTDNFIYTLKNAKNNNESALIIRPDLNWLKEIPIERCSLDAFLFQWNTFHDFSLFEVPDQIHYIGKKKLSIISKLINCKSKMGILSNGQGFDSLHNLYNCILQIQNNDQNVSYLFYFDLKNEDYIGTKCLLRGNPEVSELNNIYEYARPMSEINNVSILRRCIRKILSIFKK